MSLPRNNDLLKHARHLRKEMTKEERHLWYDYLKNCPVQFRRQKQFGYYIVDFYCASAKLVIEVDGSQHYEPQGKAYDEERSAFLSALDLAVLRFSNRDIDRDFRGVCEQIDNAIQYRLQGPLSHLR